MEAEITIDKNVNQESNVEESSNNNEIKEETNNIQEFEIISKEFILKSNKKSLNVDIKKESITNNKLIDSIIQNKKNLKKLDSNKLSPSNYFEIYMNVTEELLKIKPIIEEYIAKKSFNLTIKKIYYIFFTIRANFITKVYFLVLISYYICMDNINDTDMIKRILNNIFFYLSKIENPLVEFFIRYFTFTHLNDLFLKLPLDIAEKYVYDNAINMNNLLYLCSFFENESFQKEYKNLQCLVIQHLNCLISLNGMNVKFFKSNLIKKLTYLVYPKQNMKEHCDELFSEFKHQEIYINNFKNIQQFKRSKSLKNFRVDKSKNIYINLIHDYNDVHLILTKSYSLRQITNNIYPKIWEKFKRNSFYGLNMQLQMLDDNNLAYNKNKISKKIEQNNSSNNNNKINSNTSNIKSAPINKNIKKKVAENKPFNINSNSSNKSNNIINKINKQSLNLPKSINEVKTKAQDIINKINQTAISLKPDFKDLLANKLTNKRPDNYKQQLKTDGITQEKSENNKTIKAETSKLIQTDNMIRMINNNYKQNSSNDNIKQRLPSPPIKDNKNPLTDDFLVQQTDKKHKVHDLMASKTQLFSRGGTVCINKSTNNFDEYQLLLPKRLIRGKSFINYDYKKLSLDTDIYNEYILDWIILGIPEDYLIYCLEEIIGLHNELFEGNFLLIKKINKVIDRIVNYYLMNKKEKIKNENKKYLVDKFTDSNNKIIDIIIKIFKNTKEFTNLDIKLYMEYIYSLLEFIIISTESNSIRSNCINGALTTLDFYLKAKSNEKMEKSQKIINNSKDSSNITKKDNTNKNPNPLLFIDIHFETYRKIFDLFVNNSISFFEVQNISLIIKYFTPNLIILTCQEILVQILNTKNKIYKDDDVSFVVLLINTLISKITYNEQKKYNEEKELVRKVITNVYNPDPEKFFQLLLIIKGIYDKCNPIIMGTLEKYFICLLSLSINVESNYLKLTNNINNNNSAIKNEIYLSYELNLTKYNDQKVIDFLKINYLFVRDTIKSDFISYTEVTMSILIKAINILNNMIFSPKDFIDVCYDYFSLYLRILLNEIMDSSDKVKYLCRLVELLCKNVILPIDRYLSIANAIFKIAKSLKKRSETAKVMINICDLYNNQNYYDPEKIKCLLEEAKKDSEFSMVKTENLKLFLLLLDKMIYFYEQKKNIITIESIEEVDKYILEYLPSLKDENISLFNDVTTEYNKHKNKINILENKEQDTIDSTRCDETFQ